jgi:hypothetical protein
MSLVPFIANEPLTDEEFQRTEERVKQMAAPFERCATTCDICSIIYNLLDEHLATDTIFLILKYLVHIDLHEDIAVTGHFVYYVNYHHDDVVYRPITPGTFVDSTHGIAFHADMWFYFMNPTHILFDGPTTIFFACCKRRYSQYTTRVDFGICEPCYKRCRGEDHWNRYPASMRPSNFENDRYIQCNEELITTTPFDSDDEATLTQERD